ncbi:glycosyltransferase family 2 protein [Pontibacter sp. G13]|uniref:glycosyltransferase family 2 protein n=1 Tax=Pontibacter sp. G13 TaxID=3074898 RepID=UPI0028890148|nr:glycosyltransferase family 2 protein [Pontibacter sp. G13]WNJ18687.1 glycosyltransferase family 2 protein [Pontibacter sp. G13]
MPKSPTYVIIPVFNEALVAPSVVESVLAAGYGVIAVDDGSTDDSYRQLAKLPIHLLRHEVNLGQGAALMTGMEYATQLDCEWIVHLDADGQHAVEDIEALLAPIRAGLAEVTLGSRFLRASDESQVPKSRRMLLRWAIAFHRMYAGIALSDAHNGFRAMNRAAFGQISLKENRMAHATEILTEIKRLGLRYQEVPVSIQYTDYSKAKGQTVWGMFSILSDLITRKLLSP